MNQKDTEIEQLRAELQKEKARYKQLWRMSSHQLAAHETELSEKEAEIARLQTEGERGPHVEPEGRDTPVGRDPSVNQPTPGHGTTTPERGTTHRVLHAETRAGLVPAPTLVLGTGRFSVFDSLSVSNGSRRSFARHRKA